MLEYFGFYDTKPRAPREPVEVDAVQPRSSLHTQPTRPVEAAPDDGAGPWPCR